MQGRTNWYRLAVFFAAVLLAAGVAANPGSPDAVIEGAVTELTEKLSGRQEELAEDRDALYAMINDILLPRFDRKLAAQLVLAKHWRTANDEQRERFIMALYRSLLRTYASNILEYEGDALEVLPYEGDLSEGKAIVETRVTLETGVVTPVNYRMRLSGEDWKAYDVIIEGISAIAASSAALSRTAAG